MFYHGAHISSWCTLWAMKGLMDQWCKFICICFRWLQQTVWSAFHASGVCTEKAFSFTLSISLSHTHIVWPPLLFLRAPKFPAMVQKPQLETPERPEVSSGGLASFALVVRDCRKKAAVFRMEGELRVKGCAQNSNTLLHNGITLVAPFRHTHPVCRQKAVHPNGKIVGGVWAEQVELPKSREIMWLLTLPFLQKAAFIVSWWSRWLSSSLLLSPK